jgi:dihydroorotase
MKILIKNGRMVDPASGLDQVGDLAITASRITALGNVSADFEPDRVIDATGLIVAPGLVDLAVRLREPGHEHEGMLESELAAAAAGGVTSVVCLPDTDPTLDEPGLVEMLKLRARKLSRCRLFPLGALTRGLKGENLTEMAELHEAGCVGYSQAEVPIKDTQVLQRAMQYAATFGYTVWLRPQDPGWARASQPVALWPRVWACPGCLSVLKPLPSTPSLNWCGSQGLGCTCAVFPAQWVWTWYVRPRLRACPSRLMSASTP